MIVLLAHTAKVAKICGIFKAVWKNLKEKKRLKKNAVAASC